MVKYSNIFLVDENSELASGLRQWPGMLGFQIFSRGLQAKMSQKNTNRYTTKLLQIRQ